jgi:streptogramin lyase
VLEDRNLLSYSFTEIAEFGPNSFFSEPIMTGTLNDHGTVTFRARLGSGGEGVFTRDMQGNLGIIAITSDLISGFPIGGRINDAGTVSFGANLRDGTQAIFTGRGQQLSRIADTGLDSPFSAILPAAADVNDQETVAFRATLKSGGTGIFAERAGEPPQILYVTGGQFADLLGQNIQRNGNQVAILATLTSGGEGVFLGDGVTTTTIATTGVTYSAFAAPVANDAGLVAFMANRTGSGQVIMTGDGSHLTTIAATGGLFSHFTGNVSINNDGQVVFAADLAAGGRGIFSVRDGMISEIIGTSYSLFGSTISSLADIPFSPRALNNLGQFGFLANLADGTTVWVRADPGPAHSFNEFTIPTAGSQPLDITTGPDGNLWFSESGAGRIGKITTQGAVTEFVLPGPFTRPVGITSGPDGNIWFADDDANKVGRITPDGTITEFGIRTSASRPLGITAGPDGNLWFAEFQGNQIGRITPDGAITEFAVPTGSSGPVFIAAGPDGNVWFTEFFGNKIGRITPDGIITEFLVPTAGSLLEGIAAGADGNLWFTEFNGNKVGRITPDGRVTEFPLPSNSGTSEVIAAGPDGNLWFTDDSFNHIGQISLHGVITEFSVPTSGSFPVGITAGPDDNIWFAEYSGNKIGQFTTDGPQPPSGRTSGSDHSARKLLTESVPLIPAEGVIQVDASATALVLVPAAIVSSGDDSRLLLGSGIEAGWTGAAPAVLTVRQSPASAPVLARAPTAGATQPLLDELWADTDSDWLSEALLAKASSRPASSP